MVNHAPFRHRRAARALTPRNPTRVQVLEERFSPTAVFPGMEEDSNPFFFPGGDDDTATHRRGRHTRTNGMPTFAIPITPSPITTPEIPPPPVSIPAPTTSIAVTPITSRPILPPASTPVVVSTAPAHTTIPLTTSVFLTTASSTFPSAAAVASASSQPSSGVSAGAIVGGIGAGIIALAAIGFAVAFFIRRTRKREMDGAGGFNAVDFRRSAVVLHDPPTHEDTISHGYNPPPSSGMDQRQQTPASASAWGYTGSHYGATAYNHYEGQYTSFAPGQVVNSTSPPPTAISAQSPSMPHVAYPRQNPTSPVSPMPSPYEQPISVMQAPNNSGAEVEGYAGAPEMARQVPIAPYPTLTRQPTTRSSTQPPADDYVDLSRSSVSPFQAAQYAEISRRLNSGSPPDSSSPAQLYVTQQKDLPPVPPPQAPSTTTVSESPFADPEVPGPLPPAQLAHSSPRTANPPTPATSSTLNVQTLHVPAFSTDSLSQEELEFPVPPSPALSFSSRYRVESLPPTLPEIKVQERSSVSSYIAKSPLGSGFPSGISGVSGMGLHARSDQRFPSTPSPLASSFGVTTPVAEESRFAAAQEQGLGDQGSSQPTTTTAHASSPVADSKDHDSKRPNTVYDPEDVYGGI